MTSENVRTASLAVITLIAVMASLYILKPILLPFLIAVILTYIVSPFIEKLVGYKVPRVASLLFLLFLLITVLGILTKAIISNLVSFSEQFPEYKTQFFAVLERYSEQYPFINETFKNISDFIFSLPIASFTNAILDSSINFVSNTFLVFLFVAALSLSAVSFSAHLEKAFGEEKGRTVIKILHQINTDIRRYLSIHSLISLGVGISVGMICWIFDIPYFFLWGFLAFLLNYIPTIGSVMSAIPPIIIAAAKLGIGTAAWIAVLFVITQIIWENVIESKLMGRSLGLSALVILFSLVFWSWLWGVIGALLAIPIAIMIKIICAHIKPLQPISVLMEGQ